MALALACGDNEWQQYFVSLQACLELALFEQLAGEVVNCTFFWQMKMMVKHDKDDNLWTRAEEWGIIFKVESYVRRAPKYRQTPRRVVLCSLCALCFFLGLFFLLQ